MLQYKWETNQCKEFEIAIAQVNIGPFELCFVFLVDPVLEVTDMGIFAII